MTFKPVSFVRYADRSVAAFELDENQEPVKTLATAFPTGKGDAIVLLDMPWPVKDAGTMTLHATDMYHAEQVVRGMLAAFNFTIMLGYNK